MSVNDTNLSYYNSISTNCSAAKQLPQFSISQTTQKHCEDFSMKHFIQTLTGKITIVILLIVFPVIFMVYQNGRSTRQNWQEQQITKAEDDLALYASSMDHIFDILEETLLYLPINNNSFNQLVSFPQSDTQRHRRKISQVLLLLPSFGTPFPPPTAIICTGFIKETATVLVPGFPMMRSFPISVRMKVQQRQIPPLIFSQTLPETCSLPRVA